MVDLDEWRIVAADDSPNSLYREQKTTSVWSFKDYSQPSKPVSITTLSGAGSPSFLNSKDVDVELNKEDKFLHIQLVKRDGKYTVLVDGLETHVKPLETPAQSQTGSGKDSTDNDPCSSMLLKTSTRPTININRYKSIDRDQDTKTSVFSPCAVSVLLEDGERAPLQCVVNVKQTLEYSGKTRTGVISSTTIGSQTFEPTRLASPTADAVFTLMPMKFTRPPYAVIYDTTLIETNNALRRMGPAAWKGLGALLARSAANATGYTTGVNITYALSLALGGLGANDLAGLLTIGIATGAAATGYERGQEILKGISSYLSSTPSPEPGKLRLTIDELTRVLVALTTVVSANDIKHIKLSKSNELKNEWLVWKWLQQSEFGDASYALKEYAKDTANAEIALDKAKKEKEDADKSKDAQKITEAENALGVAQDNLENLVGAGPPAGNYPGVFERYLTRGSKLVNNPIDLSNFNFDSWTTVGIELDVNIKDAECEDLKYLFVCEDKKGDSDKTGSGNGVADNCILFGAMAFDMKSKIEALWKAIRCFESRLEAAINTANGAPTFTWVSEYFILTKTYINQALGTATGSAELYKNAQDALTDVEKRSIQAVYKNINQKLWKTLGGKGREPGKLMTPEQKQSATQLDHLYDKLLVMEEKTEYFANSPSGSNAIGIRALPHAVFGRALFPSAEKIELGESDIQTSEVVVKQSSEIKDAITVASRTVRKNAIALRALQDDWERGRSRCRFVHGVKLELPKTPDATTEINHSGVLDAVTLVLNPPKDVLVNSASSSIPEKEQLFQDMVTKEPGWLETFGGSGSSAYATLSMFAQVLLDEVLKFYSDQDRESAAVNQSIRGLSARARDRVKACADLLLVITKRKEFGYFHSSDPVFIATQPGRDLALLTRILHIPDNASAHVIQHLQSVARSMHTSAAALYQKIKKDPLLIKRIPYEPLNSMFFCPSAGLRAEYRVNRCIELYKSSSPIPEEKKKLVVDAVKGAYPSLRFTDEKWRKDQKMPGPEPQDAWSSTNPVDIQKILKRRLASLRIDPLDTLGNKKESGCNKDDIERFVEELSDHFMQVKVSSSKSAHSRYSVDFAQGTTTPLRELAQQTPMFGSVPIWTEYLRWGFDQLLLDRSSGLNTDCNLIKPVFERCTEATKNSTFYGQMKHPLWIIVTDSESKTRTIRVFGSISNQNDGSNTVFEDSNARLSAAVSSIAWNAERFLQAVLVSAAYDGSKGICVDVSEIADGAQKEYLTGVVVGIAMSRALLHTQTPSYFKIVNTADATRSYNNFFKETRTAVSDGVDDQGHVNRSVPASLRLSEVNALLATCMGIVSKSV